MPHVRVLLWKKTKSTVIIYSAMDILTYIKTGILLYSSP